jgi:hypothetical protein
MLRNRKLQTSRSAGHFWAVFLPFYLLAAAALDPTEVTNREYLRFVSASGYPSPEHWVHGLFPAGTADEPVVLVTMHDAAAYCAFVGRRLPTLDEWMSSCQAGNLKKRDNIWEWTSSDVGAGFKALCGPGYTCDCSHRYLPEWKNEVKGFRCVRDALPVTWLPFFFNKETLS